MSECVSSSEHWSASLPGFLQKSWFVLVLGPPLVVFAAVSWSRIDRGSGHALQMIVLDLLLSCFLALSWLVLFLLVVAVRRGNVARWLWPQAATMLCFWLYLCYEINS